MKKKKHPKDEFTHEEERRIAAKIGHLVAHEGKDQKQAAGEAYAMARAHRLGKGGEYRRVTG